MKTLYLVRHAKSSWDYPELSDFDRPLNHRGERDAPRMGQYLNGLNIRPYLLLSSPANRALTTAKKIATIIGYTSQVATDDRIYHAGSSSLLSVVQDQDDQMDSLMLFGHNPGFTDFANALANENIDNIPTAGACQIDFDVQNWNEVDFGKGRMIFFQYPKGL